MGDVCLNAPFYFWCWGSGVLLAWLLLVSWYWLRKAKSPPSSSQGLPLQASGRLPPSWGGTFHEASRKRPASQQGPEEGEHPPSPGPTERTTP